MTLKHKKYRLTLIISALLCILLLNPIYRIKPKSTTLLEELGALDILDPKTLEMGKQEMSKHKVFICGITRDNAKELPTVIKYIEHTGGFFKDYRVAVFENDSKDGTKEILKKWSENNKKMKVLSKDYHNARRINFKFLAIARNEYIQELRKNPEYKDFDMVMIVDLDMPYGWDVRGIFNSFYHINQWEAICSNGVFTSNGHMWDMFAFRSEDFPNTPEDPDYWENTVPNGQKIYTAGSDLVPVDSCFGGLAFYKRDFIKDCHYDSIKNDCEHVVFHQCLHKNKGRIFMNPSQILRYSHYDKPIPVYETPKGI